MQQEWLKKRLDTFLPALMRKHGIDMWVVPMREYNEDPVFSSITAPETFAARRRTIYVFFDMRAPPPREAHRARRHVAGRRVRGETLDQGGGGRRRPRTAGGALGRRAVAGPQVRHRGAQAPRHRHQSFDRVRVLRRPVERRAERHDGGARRHVDLAVQGRRRSAARADRLAPARRGSVLREDAGARLVDDADDVLERGHHAGQDEDERPRLVVAAARQRPGARHVVPAERRRCSARA